MVRFDRIVIGAGIYGLYAAIRSAELGKSVLVMDCGENSFQKASYVNQARIHNGLHYPRSLETAIKCRNYYRRFIEDHKDCINENFDAIYAVAASGSYVGAREFERFMGKLELDYQQIISSKFFRSGSVEAAYKVKEATFDYVKLRKHYVERASYYGALVQIKFGCRVNNIQYMDGEYIVNGMYCAPFLLNTTYASVNQVAKMLTDDLIKTKYELCEVVLCNVPRLYLNVGITVMDGGFFSLMPWGNSPLYTLTSVHHTPHYQYYGTFPKFECMKGDEGCSERHLEDCNTCSHKPQSAFEYMMSIVNKFLPDSHLIKYSRSLFAVKSILSTAEDDDSRPTIIKKYDNFKGFYSVLSGKISTIYELDEILG